MASRIIGIEFGSDTLKLAVVSGGMVRTMAVARMPENLIREGRITSAPALTQFVKEVCRRYGIRGGKCALVLPPQTVIAHQVTMPVMSENELKLNLPFEFRDFVGKEGSKYDYDYSVMSVHDNVMELYAAAVRKDLVESYYSALKKAGLTMKVAIPSEMAWLNLVLQGKNVSDKLCIVDVGHSNTRVNFFVNGTFVMGRDIEMGGALLDETIASRNRIDTHSARNIKDANMDGIQSCDELVDVYQALAVEVVKTVEFFNYSGMNQGAPLEHLYYCGGSSNIEGLRTAILKNTGLTCHHAQRLLPVTDEGYADLALYCAQAAGAALQQ